MSLYTKDALNNVLAALIAAAASGQPLENVELISKHKPLDLRTGGKWLKVSVAEWFETEGRGDEMSEHDCLFYLESFVRPATTNFADEESALDDAIEIMQTVQRELIANTDLDGAVCALLADKFPFNAGMSKIGSTRFAVCILPIVINPMRGK